VARASLEELKLDYEDFLRQRGLAVFAPDHPALVRFKRRRCATLEAVQAWGKQYFLDRQVERLANDFENEGGFTERLYRGCSSKRSRYR
jgi:four helix bundle suffix protein